MVKLSLVYVVEVVLDFGVGVRLCILGVGVLDVVWHKLVAAPVKELS